MPVKWHGNYDADALQYLAVHGGITYCNFGGGDESLRNAAMKLAAENNKTTHIPGDLDASLKSMVAKCEAIKTAEKSVPYEWVVFGFDCAHAGDENDPNLRDPDYVFRLVEDMEKLLHSYISILPEWRNANRETRAKMLDKINNEIEHKSEPGFGAMIGLLSGAPEFGQSEEN